jgi:hypothetical protein
MSYADVNGVCLYYEEHGSGQPAAVVPFLEPPPPAGP